MPTPTVSTTSVAMPRKLLAGAVILVSVALFVFLIAKTRNEFAIHSTIGRPADVRDTFTIEGEGKISAQPTLAQISFGLLSEGTDVAKIQAENSTKMNQMIASVKTLGIDDKDIQTSQYSINPQYDYTNGTTKLKGYQISQNVSLKLRDLSKIGDVLTRVGQLGGNQVNGPTFTIDDPTALNQEARLKALEDARKKAEALSSVLGVRVGRVVTFTESVGGMNPPTPMMYRADVANEAFGGAAPTIQSGSLDVVSRVSVTFEAL